jgi:riboflavin transporter FmnP
MTENDVAAFILARATRLESCWEVGTLLLAIYKKSGSYQTIIRVPESAPPVGSYYRGRLDTISIAGSAIFSSLALVLGAASQAAGLNFPLIPYLQFDLGEVAIILAFFIFGPVPALVSSAVEFGGLMVFGQQIPIGPLLKLFALASTVAGLWIGTKLASRGGETSLFRLVGWSTLVGGVVRAAAMTIPNLYLIVYLYGLAGIEGVLKAPFALIGITLTDSSALFVVLLFTAAFNLLQLFFVMGLSSFVLRVPAISRIRVGGRSPWFATVLREAGRQAAQPLR